MQRLLHISEVQNPTDNLAHPARPHRVNRNNNASRNTLLERDRVLSARLIGVNTSVSSPIAERAALRRQSPILRIYPDDLAREDVESLEQLRESLCIGIAPGTGPVRRNFSPAELARVTAAASAAQNVIGRARLRFAIGGGDVGRLALRHFGAPELQPNLFDSTTTRIALALRRTPRICGTCFDEGCNERGRTHQAYVPNDLGSMVICPIFFRSTPAEMRHTLLHEAGHAAGVDDQPNYSHPANCAESATLDCGACAYVAGDRRRNVDVWANFLQCLAFW
ncbi:MAG TPA: hypothetical protein VI670_00350 [Thermoanaerobaculia bacterium]|jgi:hypothetical protein